jgi:hypothetical protein
VKEVKSNGRRVSLRRLTATDLAFLHFKAALGFMLFVPIFQSSSLKNQTTALFLWIWLAVTIIGLLVSVVGLVMGAQLDDMRRRGIRVEMTGLSLLLAGPLVFMAVQLGLFVTGGRSSGLAVMFPYVVIAALLARMVMVATSAKVVYRIRGVDFHDD